MRRLAEHSGPPGHMYPLALLCYDIMPPPQDVSYPCYSESTNIYCSWFNVTKVVLQVEKEIGEKRIISFHGVGLSVAPAISFSETTASCESPEKVG